MKNQRLHRDISFFFEILDYRAEIEEGFGLSTIKQLREQYKC